MKNYVYENLAPYGAGEMFYLNGWLPDDFSGNVVDYMMKTYNAHFEEPVGLEKSVCDKVLVWGNGNRVEFCKEA